MNESEYLVNFLGRKPFSTFSAQILMIDPNSVAKINTHYSVIEAFGDDGRPSSWVDLIQIVYTNGATDELPRTEENLKMVALIEHEKSRQNKPK